MSDLLTSANDTAATRRRSRPLALAILIAGLVALLAADVGWGVFRGSHEILFNPIYRTRQAIAIALSRMIDPPLGKYLAYGSVVDSLSRSGMAVFQGDPGPAYDTERVNRLFTDPEAVDEALASALATPIDPSRPDQLLLGNELAQADYFHLGFLLFGVHAESLFYFTFLLVGISTAFFILEYRRDPLPLVVVGLYLTGILFFEEYARHITNLQLASIQNSRGFDLLSMLPALHMAFFVLFNKRISWGSGAALAGQAAIFTLFMMCRFSVAWQLLFIGIVVVLGVVQFLAMRGDGGSTARTIASKLAPFVFPLLMVVAYTTLIETVRDERYAGQPSRHIFWHNLLSSTLSVDNKLGAMYAGDVSVGADQLAYNAVQQRINETNDEGSVLVAGRLEDGTLYINPTASWDAYEEVAKDIVLDVAAKHPFEVGMGFVSKLYAQFWMQPGIMIQRIHWGFVVAVGGLAAAVLALGASAGAFSGGRWAVAIAAIVFLGCAGAPGLVFPTPLNVGSLLGYLIVAVLAAAWVVWLIVRGLGQLLRRGAREPN